MKKYLSLFLLTPLLAFAAGGAVPVEKQEWSFSGLHGHWDKAQLLRGYEVATQVCLSCHSFKYIDHRTMMEAGFSEEEAKTLAADMGVKLDDKFKSAMSDEDAKEVYGKPLPDLSMMNKARPNGADYVYALLTGYAEDPKLVEKMVPGGMPEGTYFNTAFPGHAIAMPNPLSDGIADHRDGTDSTIEQMAKDVTYFMQWTAEPELIKRKHTGVYVLIYLFIFTVLTFLLKNKIWARVK